MQRALQYHIPGVVCLFCAFILLFLVSLSLPFIDSFDLVRVHFTEGSPFVGLDDTPIDELRFGTWADCCYEETGELVCSPPGLGYATTVYSPTRDDWVTIGPSWTRGLALHPAATCLAFIAFVFSFSSHRVMSLLAWLASLAGALLTLVAFAADIALLAFVQRQMHKLSGVVAKTTAAPAFWMTFSALFLLCTAALTIFLGRTRNRLDGATHYNWKDRFLFQRQPQQQQRYPQQGYPHQAQAHPGYAMPMPMQGPPSPKMMMHGQRNGNGNRNGNAPR